MDKIKVIIIDDSDFLGKMIETGFSEDEKVEIIGRTSDISKSRDLILGLKPDALILNIEKTPMKTIAFLRNLLSEIQLPVVVLSSSSQKGKLIALQALESGAIDFVFTPTSDVQRNIKKIISQLYKKLITIAKANIPFWKPKLINASITTNQKYNQTTLGLSNKIIAIGASTGGTEAISNIITRLPVWMPGIVVAIPLPSGFTKTFAERLNVLSKVQVKEAENGDKIINGRVFIAPGDFHIKIIRFGGRYKVVIENGEKINDHRPCIDILMSSLAEQAGPNAYGIILTGEGSDGALGLKSMKDNGATTIVQDENTSIIYDMPKSAIDLKAADYQLALDKIAERLIELIR